MARKRLKLGVGFEYILGEDSESHLLQAFDLLFQGIVIDPEIIEAESKKSAALGA